MSRLQSWYDRCAELWKATKPISAEKLTELAGQMDKKHGPWTTEGLGSRSEAVQHYVSVGKRRALKEGRDAAVHTPERRAFEFARDMTRHARSQVVSRSAMQVSGDTMTDAIDKDHIDHYATRWAEHNGLLESVPRGKQVEVDGATVRSLTNKHHTKANPVQVRAPIISRRMKMMQAGGAEPTFSMDDLKTIHAGVERAIGAGKVSTGSANRYHVMRRAMQVVHDQHHDPEFPAGVPFKPSYAALDTESLKVMHVGVQHLDDQGFRDAKTRLTPILESAVKAHAEHPYQPRSTPRRQEAKRVSVSYPDLHPMGSDAHKKQLTADSAFRSSIESQRQGGRSSAPAPKAVSAPKAAATPKAEAPAAATAEAPAAPAMSYDDYKKRAAAGEEFSPAVHLQMAKLGRMKKSLNAAVGSSQLLKAWKVWRKEAA